MKAKLLTLLAAIAIMACLISTAAAISPPTYAIEKTAPSDPVNIGDTVTMTATTNNALVNTVVFTWYAPNGTMVANVTDLTPSNGFTSDLKVDATGEWIVVATFENTILNGGELKPVWFNPITTQVRVGGDFFVVPEYPLMGAVGIAVPMALALLVFKRKEISSH
jgi:hypothetical protein